MSYRILREGIGLMRRQRGITGLETAIVLIAFVIVASVFAFAALSTGLFSSEQAKDTIKSGLSQAQGTLMLRSEVTANTFFTTGEVAVPAAASTGTLANLTVVRGSEVLTHSDATPMVKVVAGSETTEYTYSINYVTGDVTVGAAVSAGEQITAAYNQQVVDSIKFRLANASGGISVDLTPGQTTLRYSDGEQSVDVDGVGDFTLVTNLGSADDDNFLEPGEIIEINIPNLKTALSPDLASGTSFEIVVQPPLAAALPINRTTPGSLIKINDLG